MGKSHSLTAGLVLLLFAFACLSASGQVLVNSFSALKPHLGANNVSVVMTPGTYRIRPADVSSGLFTNATLLSFSGTNSVFDFSGVTFEVETEVFQSFGNVEVIELALWGQNLVIKNLTVIDIGNARPGRTALGVLLDGRTNRLEGCNFTIRGSYPYGYGDMFGKGSGYVIKHYKHSAILVRGDSNRVKDCKIFHRAYGHGIFCQGSLDARIEGCYVEGEVRSSDDVLAEAGTGSPADNVNFMTVWGYPLQPGWMFSRQEDGIRAYNTGYPDPDTRNTRNMQVINCTVKNMRSGVTIGFCDSTKYVEGCVVLGVENGYWVGSGGQVVNCSGNAPFGPLYENSYQNDSGATVDLTVLDNEEIYGDQSILAYIGGSGHKLTFRSRDQNVNPNLRIMSAGSRDGIRFFVTNQYNTLSANNILLTNLTQYPVVLANNASGNSGRSGGPVTNLGVGNVITPISVTTCGGFGVLQTIQAENFCAQSGVAIEASSGGGFHVGMIENGDWIRFDNFFLGSGPNRFRARVASGTNGGDIELRLDGPIGPVIGTMSVPVNQDPNAWTTNMITLAEPRGRHDLYLVFKGGSGTLMHLDSFKFYVTFPGHESVDVVPDILAAHWRFDEASGSVAADSSGHGYHGTNVNASWIAGIDGNALNFNGSISKVIIPATAFTNLSSKITIAMWVYGDALQPLADSVFYAVDGANKRVLNIHLPWSDTNVFWDAGFSGTFYDRINKLAVAAQFKGGWNHWVFTKDAVAGVMRIYHNGTLWHSGTGKTKTITGITNATIGSQITGVYYRGAIDDVLLYNVALSDQEIKNLYYDYAIFRVNGLMAQALNSTQINLTWNATPGATGYNLKRSLTSDGPYSLLAGRLASTNYPDTGLSAGTNYYYVVSAIFGADEGSDSTEVSAVPSAPINPADVVMSSVVVSSDGVGGQHMTMSVPNSGLGHNRDGPQN